MALGFLSRKLLYNRFQFGATADNQGNVGGQIFRFAAQRLGGFVDGAGDGLYAVDDAAGFAQKVDDIEHHPAEEESNGHGADRQREPENILGGADVHDLLTV